MGERLHWNKPERVTLQEGMIVTYRDISAWNQSETLISWSGNKCKVRGRDGATRDDILSNFYVWTSQETDQRDVFKG
jgi:hypothetical protein